MPERVVSLFRDKRVISARPVLASSGPFVRGSSAVCDRISQLLTEARAERWGRRRELTGTDRWIRKLVSELTGDAPLLRVLAVVEWYASSQPWRSDKMVPWIDGGPSLYEKFSRLEECMRRLGGSANPEETPRDIIKLVVGNGTVLSRFEETVLAPARRLHLSDDELALAHALCELYSGIRDERARVRVTDELASQMGGPADLLRRYLSWVGEHDWTATLRVLQYNSPSFAQFRREAARMDARDRDPVTGKSVR